MDIEYDVAIVGGGPIGLSTAYELATQRGQRVIVFEKSSLHNAFGSSPGFGRQWRIPYAEKWLLELAIQASSAWDDLMNQTNHHNLVDRTGVLWFGDPTVTTPEGQINAAAKNMEELKQEYTLFNDPTELKERFPWLASGIDAEPSTVGMFSPDGGTINIPAVFHALLHSLYASKRAIIEENTQITKISVHEAGVTLSDQFGNVTKAKKLVLTPGAYINEVLDTFEPSYPSRLHLTIYLWMSNYYKLNLPSSEITTIPNRLPRPSSDNWPVWIYFGPVDETNTDEDKPVNGNSYYGFPSDVQDAAFDSRVAPGFTSTSKFTFYDKPPKPEERSFDEPAIDFTKQFIGKWMKTSVNPNEMDPRKSSTCIAGFATLADGSNTVDAEGFVLDILPNTHDNVVVCTGGWAMKFVPLFGRIISDLIETGKAPNYKIEDMRWNRGITIDQNKCGVCPAKELPHRKRLRMQRRVCH